MGLFVVGFESVIYEIVQFYLPFAFPLLDLPLVHQGHNTGVSVSRNDFGLRFLVDSPLVAVDQQLLGLDFGVLDQLPFELAHNHSPFVKALLVAHVLGLFKEFSVLVRIDLQLGDGIFCTPLPELGHLQDVHEIPKHVNFDVLGFALELLVPQLLQHDLVVGRV